MTAILNGASRLLCWFILLTVAILPSRYGALAGSNTWTGNGPAGGIIWALEFDPSDPNVVYAGGYNHGVYKSTDSGATWTETKQPAMQVTLLVADPANGGTLYAANAWGAGLYKSTDKGVTWMNIGQSLGSRDIRGFAYDPATPTTLYAAVLNSGVYKSTDGGMNWTMTNSGMAEFSFYAHNSLALDRRNPGTLYVGSAGTPCLYKSTNGGASWTPAAAGLDFITPYAVKVDPSNSNNVYIAAYGKNCFWKSTNGGSTWTASTTGIPAKTDGYYSSSIAVDPSNPASLFLATANGGLFKSTNRGDTWSAAGPGIFNVDTRIAVVHPTNPAILFAGTWGSGIFKSTNGAAGWSQQSLCAIQIKSLSVNPIDPRIIYASSMGGGVLKSTDQGQTWTYMGLSSVQVPKVAVDPRAPSTVWAIASGLSGVKGVLKSTDSGGTWHDAFTGFNETSFQTVTPDPAVSGVVYVGTSSSGGGIYRTTNGGSTWSSATTGIPKSTVQQILVDPVSTQTLYAVAGNVVYKSNSGGTSWAEASTGLPSKKAQTLAIDPRNPSILYAGLSGGGIYKTTTGGNTWSALTLPTGFTTASAYSILVDPKDAAVVYAGTSGGVLRSADGGATWTAMNSGLVDKAVFALASGPQDASTIHAGTSSKGAYSFSSAAVALTLFYPRLVTTDGTGGNPESSEYTGIGVANLGTTDASLTFTAYDVQGRLVSGAGITNPATVPLSKGAQLPIVDVQVWGSGLPAAKPVGWFTMDSTSSKVVGFFLTYNANLSVLDGADVSSARLDNFVFPEVETNGFTQLHVANPNTAAASVTFELWNAGGSLRKSVSRAIPANGSVSEQLKDMFAGEALDGSEFVAVRGAGLVPFEYLGNTPYRVAGLSGQNAAGGATTLYSPQYAVGGGYWATTLSVVNLEGTAGNVTFRLINDRGQPIGATRTLPIAANGKVRIADQGFFLQAGGTLEQGYVEITSSGPKLAGSVVFGDPAGTAFAAALPLVGTLQSNLVFSQVASNHTWYTGLALLNPGSADAAATIEVFDRNGQLLRSKVQTIRAGGRESGLLTQYFPELAGAEISSGYIRVVSDKPVAGFALFGAENVLSAVPPQLVP